MAIFIAISRVLFTCGGFVKGRGGQITDSINPLMVRGYRWYVIEVDMSKIILNAEARDGSGKAAARRMRRAGRLPGVVYGANKDPESLSLSLHDFKKAYAHENFFSSIFELEGFGEKGAKYIVKDLQYHPVSDEPMHIDFMRVAKGTKVAVKIALHFTNKEKSPGLKMGGVLNILAHDMEVLCDPDFIPEFIEIDMTGAEFHHSIHAEDVKLPEGLSLPVGIKNYTVATVVAPTIVKDAAPAAEA